MLNESTVNYQERSNIETVDIFDGLDNDADRIYLLSTEGYIDQVIRPQQSNATFGWNVDSQMWQLFIDGNPYSAATTYDFSTTTLEQAALNGMYVFQEDRMVYNEDEGRVELEAKRGKLLNSTTEDEYEFTVEFESEAGTTDARIFFIFDFHDSSNLDKGEGYNILLRQNKNFARLQSISNGTRRSTLETYYYTDSTIIPSKTDDPNWYFTKHTAKIVVSRVDADTKNVAIYIDGTFLRDYDYDQELITETVYFGIGNIGGGNAETYVYNID